MNFPKKNQEIIQFKQSPLKRRPWIRLKWSIVIRTFFQQAEKHPVQEIFLYTEIRK